MGTKSLIAATFLSAVAVPVACGATVHVAFFVNGHIALVDRQAPEATVPIDRLIGLLVEGPTPTEQAQGFSSAIPHGTALIHLDASPDTVDVDLSPAVLNGLDEAMLLSIFDQFRATLNDFPGIVSIRLTSGGRLLSSFLSPSPIIQPGLSDKIKLANTMLASAALSGRNITIGPSHGRCWNGSGWYWQRSDPCYFGEAVLEDTNSIRLMQFLNQYLTQDGAVVYSCRELNESNCCNGDTGLPWWKMSAVSWLRASGLPCSVWGSSSGNCGAETAVSRYNDDIRARPLYADYRNSDIYIACHTNAGGGGTANGTETYRDTAMEHPAHEANSLNLATNIQNSVVSGIREMYDASWTNRGVKDSAGGFGEIRIPDRPAALIELAFHDNCGRDAAYLTDNFFRSVAEWSLYRGVCQYFGTTPTWDRYSDEYASDTIPSTMNAGQTYNVSITFRNRGILWTAAKSFRLGAVGDSDPFTSSTRFTMSGEVRPGDTYTFNFTVTAPATPGTYTTDWRMVRDGVTWFGATCTKQVQVNSPPIITQQPVAQFACPGTTVQFSVTASGAGTLTYRWQKNGADLSDVGHYSGSTSASLSISNADSGDVADYRCVVTNAGGSTTSNPAALTLKPTVAADVDHDCDVDASDIAVFQACISGPSSPLTSGCETVDFDHDSDVDQSDFGILQRCLSGENNVPDPNCAN